MSDSPPTSSSLAGVRFEELDRLGHLYLEARTLVDGLYQGRHAAPVHGGSTEFYDFQMYAPGDDPARIDWKVFGRTDRLYRRRFQHFGELTLHLVVDCSNSMDYTDSSSHPLSTRKTITKWLYAQHLAAALAFFAIRQSERVALGLVGDRIERSLPPGGSWRHLMKVIHTLEATEPSGTTDLPTGLAEAQALVPLRRVMIIVSDGLCESTSLTKAVEQLRYHGNDVSFIQILTRSELDLSGLGEAARFVDLENLSVSMRARLSESRVEYIRLMQEHLRVVRRGIMAAGASHHLVTTDQHPFEALRAVLRARMLAGRLR